MEFKILMSILELFGIQEPTEADQRRLANKLKVEKWSMKTKVAVMIFVPVLKNGLDILLENLLHEND